MILDETEITKFYTFIEKQFTKWAKTQGHIRIAVVVGSRARTDALADKWSGLDIAIFSTQPNLLIESKDWVGKFGNPVITFIEPTSRGSGQSFERRVLYDNGLDVDFVIGPFHFILKSKEQGIPEEFTKEMADIIGRGIRILVDKDNIMNRFLKQYRALEVPPPSSPTEDEYHERVNNFW